MKRYLLAISGLLVLLLFLSSCSNEELDVTPQATAEEEIEANIVQETSSEVYINNVKLNTVELKMLKETYGDVIPGKYWYDSKSGLYGRWHEAPLGYLLPGHQFATLSEDASNGDTGLFINGRELPEIEVLYLETVLGARRKGGGYWLDAQGNIGLETNPRPFANLFLAAAKLQQAQQQAYRKSGDGSGWNSYYTNSYGNEQNGFGYVVVDGASVTYG